MSRPIHDFLANRMGAYGQDGDEYARATVTGHDIEAAGGVKELVGLDTEVPYSEAEAEVSLQRGLKARHITMIAIGGAVGTGLLIGTGSALAK